MALRLDHFFILTGTPEPAADLLREIGMSEGASNTHPGQGSANRRFFCANTTLELLYLRDAAEAENGPGKQLGLAQRLEFDQASPFGLIFRTDADSAPFPAWAYYPDYLPDGMHFLVGANSADLSEPLCICMPDRLQPPADAPPPENPDWRLTGLRVSVPVARPSQTLRRIAACPEASVNPGHPHLLELTFNHRQRGRTHDFSPCLQLVIRC